MSKILFFCVLLMTLSVDAQEISPRIASGRPGQSIGAGVVGRGVLQIQSGFDLSKADGTSDTKTLLSNNIIRFGISDIFEISSLINYQKDSMDTNGLVSDQDGVSSFQLGFRNRVIKQSNGLIPALAIQTRFKLKNVAKNYREDHIAPVMIISMVHGIDETFSLTHNFGANYNGNTGEPRYFFTSNLGFNLCDQMESFVEIYGNSFQDKDYLYADTGLGYYIGQNLKLDMSLGGGNNHGVSEAFISLGLSWRNILF